MPQTVIHGLCIIFVLLCTLDQCVEVTGLSLPGFRFDPCNGNGLYSESSSTCIMILDHFGFYEDTKEHCEGSGLSMITVRSVNHFDDLCDYAKRHISSLAFFYLDASLDPSNRTKFVWNKNGREVIFPYKFWMDKRLSGLPCLELFSAGSYCRLNDIVCNKESWTVCERPPSSGPCATNNGGCDQICLLRHNNTHACRCIPPYYYNGYYCTLDPYCIDQFRPVYEIPHTCMSVIYDETTSQGRMAETCSTVRALTVRIGSKKYMNSICRHILKYESSQGGDYFIEQLSSTAYLVWCGRGRRTGDNLRVLHVTRTLCCLMFKPETDVIHALCVRLPNGAYCQPGYDVIPQDEGCLVFTKDTNMMTGHPIAREACRKDRGDLVSLEREAIRTFFMKKQRRIRSSRHKMVWIGLTRLNDQFTKWAWSDDDVETSYYHWSSGKPDGRVTNCVVIVPRNAEWQPEYCDNSNYFICQLTEAECHRSWQTMTESKCISVSMFDATGGRTTECSLSAWGPGKANSLVIESASEQERLEEFYSDLETTDKYYINLKRTKYDPEWHWNDHRNRKVAATYFNWKGGRPDVKYEENCVYTLRDGTWDDEGCSYLKHFACVRPKETIQVPPRDLCGVNNGGCYHRCVNTGDSYHCVCPVGFELHYDTECKDKNECNKENAGCLQKCVNTYGSYLCECNFGFHKTSSGACVRNQSISEEQIERKKEEDGEKGYPLIDIEDMFSENEDSDGEDIDENYDNRVTPIIPHHDNTKKENLDNKEDFDKKKEDLDKKVPSTLSMTRLLLVIASSFFGIILILAFLLIIYKKRQLRKYKKSRRRGPSAMQRLYSRDEIPQETNIENDDDQGDRTQRNSIDNETERNEQTDNNEDSNAHVLNKTFTYLFGFNRKDSKASKYSGRSSVESSVDFQPGDLRTGRAFNGNDDTRSEINDTGSVMSKTFQYFAGAATSYAQQNPTASRRESQAVETIEISSPIGTKTAGEDRLRTTVGCVGSISKNQKDNSNTHDENEQQIKEQQEKGSIFGGKGITKTFNFNYIWNAMPSTLTTKEKDKTEDNKDKREEEIDFLTTKNSINFHMRLRPATPMPKPKNKRKSKGTEL